MIKMMIFVCLIICFQASFINCVCELKYFMHQSFVGETRIHENLEIYLNRIGDLGDNCRAKVNRLNQF